MRTAALLMHSRRLRWPGKLFTEDVPDRYHRLLTLLRPALA